MMSIDSEGVTDEEAERMLVALKKHFGEPVMPISKYCGALKTWSECLTDRADSTPSESPDKVRHTATANEVRHVFLQISKSCLLDRLLYVGEPGPRKEPCPVHKGVWSGIHAGWPGEVWHHIDGTSRPGTVSKSCQEWYDAGCRCASEGCGCTSGWQPDLKSEPKL